MERKKLLDAAKNNKKIFRVGHGAYVEWSGNHPAKDYLIGKSAAIDELRSRGVKRNNARFAVNNAAKGNWDVSCNVEIIMLDNRRVILEPWNC